MLREKYAWMSEKRKTDVINQPLKGLQQNGLRLQPVRKEREKIKYFEGVLRSLWELRRVSYENILAPR